MTASHLVTAIAGHACLTVQPASTIDNIGQSLFLVHVFSAKNKLYFSGKKFGAGLDSASLYYPEA